MAYDYDLALAKAKDLGTIHTLDLIEWSSNYNWHDLGNPLVAFYGLTGLFDGEYVVPLNATFGYVELDYMADALKEYATKPGQVEMFLEWLAEQESN